MTDSLNYPFLLLTHVVCADGQIHSEEARTLHHLAAQINLDPATQAEMDKILDLELDALSVQTVASRISVDKQKETMHQMLAIAHVDGYYAPLEKNLVDQVCKIWGMDPRKVEVIRKAASAKKLRRPFQRDRTPEQQLSIAARLLKNEQKSLLSRAILGMATQLAPETLGRSIKKLEREVLLSGPEYDETIDRCSRIAKEDYEFARPALDSSYKSLVKLGTSLKKMTDTLNKNAQAYGANTSAQQVVQQLEVSRKFLTREILQQLEALAESLRAKKRALNHFSIAFMGKTKSGKSTLHAIVTGEGWDAIGVGKQRTTRLNRVYEWKNIRVIDTPGIGAPGGKSDEEIAKSVIDESDVICYVVTNDSIQETEFRFVNLLKAKAKPLIVLLNVKHNLRDPRRLEHFLKNSRKFFTMEGSSGLKGHINRINDYATRQGVENYFPVIPAMLLAAQLSYEPENESISTKLYEISQVQDFLNSIRESLIYYGAIRRSQTLLGSTVGSIEKPKSWLQQQVKTYSDLTILIQDKQKTVKDKLSMAKAKAIKSFGTRIGQLFAKVSQDVPEFAESNWSKSEQDLNDAWQEKLKQINLAAKLGAIQDNTIEQFKKDIQEIVAEVGKEMSFIAQFTKEVKFNLDEQDHSAFFAGFLNFLAKGFLSRLLPPIRLTGIILHTINKILGIFETKDQKRRKASQQIQESLSGQLSSYKSDVIKDFNQNFENNYLQVEKSIDDYFDELVHGLKQIRASLDQAVQELETSINKINLAYGKRVLDWCLDRYEPLSQANINKSILRVSRDFAKAIHIYPKQPVRITKNQADIESVIQEKFFCEDLLK